MVSMDSFHEREVTINVLYKLSFTTHSFYSKFYIENNLNTPKKRWINCGSIKVACTYTSSPFNSHIQYISCKHVDNELYINNSNSYVIGTIFDINAEDFHSRRGVLRVIGRDDSTFAYWLRVWFSILSPLGLGSEAPTRIDLCFADWYVD